MFLALCVKLVKPQRNHPIFYHSGLDTDAQQVCGRRKGQRCTIAVPDMIVEMDPVGDQLSISVTGIA